MAQLVSNLGEISKLFIGNAQKALEQTAEEIGAAAAANAPVKTGALRDSKTVEIAYLVALVGFTAEHAPFVEFGTSRFAGRFFFTSVWLMAEQIYREKFAVLVQK